MEPFSGIKAISFDAVGTLFCLRRTVGEGYAEVAGQLGIQLDANRVNQVFREVWLATPEREDAERVEDDRGFWRELVQQVMSNCEVSLEAEQFEAFFREAYSHYEGGAEWKLFPETIGVLEQLAARLPLAITSNYDGRIYRTLQDLGIHAYFQVVTVSSEVGSDKPSPGIFHATCRALSLEPSAILHVGDERKSDFEGAMAAGMTAWLLERPSITLANLPLLQ